MFIGSWKLWRLCYLVLRNTLELRKPQAFKYKENRYFYYVLVVQVCKGCSNLLPQEFTFYLRCAFIIWSARRNPKHAGS